MSLSVSSRERDRTTAAARGIVGRTHGGAVPADAITTADLPFSRRARTAQPAKQRIGRAAAAFVSDHTTLLLNGGTTTLQVAIALRGYRDLTIVTNNLQLPAVMPQDAVRELYLIGGLHQADSQVTIGPVAFPGTSGMSADTAFIGVGGISTNGGLSTTNVAEARMMREMIEAARQVVVVCDATKFDHNAFVHIAGFQYVSALVTDDRPPARLMDALAAAGVDVLVAEP